MNGLGLSGESPKVVDDASWLAARDQLAEDEQALSEAARRLAARRRRMPVRAVEDYALESSAGPTRLHQLFESRRQLLLYHFYAPDDGAPICMGCSAWIDNLGDLSHLQARDTSFAMVSMAPWTHLSRVQERMTWPYRWVSAAGTSMATDFGVTEWAGLSALIRDDDDRVFQTFFTAGADLERLRNDFNLLDFTLLGRSESWEDSPPGWPQEPAFSWWHLKDEYPPAPRAGES